MRHAAIAAALALTLASCGSSNDPTAQKAGDNPAWDRFASEFTGSCERAAQNGATADAAKAYCGCALDKVKTQFTTAEVMTLDVTKMKPIMEQCAAETGLNAGGRSTPAAEGNVNG